MGVDGVTLHDRLSDEELRAAYRAADLLVLPLLEGGSSNALNEALATGLPVVASALPNLADYAPAACVELVAPGDAVAFAEACRGLLVDDGRRRAAAAAARRHALTLDWREVKAELVDDYRRLLSRPDRETCRAGCARLCFDGRTEERRWSN